MWNGKIIYSMYWENKKGKISSLFFYRNAKRDSAEYVPRIITKCSTSSRIFRDTRFQIGVRSFSARTYMYTWAS